jgi:hypothetical protein
MPQIIAIITAMFFLLTGCSGQSKELALQREALESMHGELLLVRKERAEKDAGWWNWKLRQEGIGSWISTKTIAATTTVAAIAATLGFLYWKIGQVEEKADTAGSNATLARNDLQDHEELTTTAHQAKVPPPSKVKSNTKGSPKGSPSNKPESKVPSGGADKPSD